MITKFKELFTVKDLLGGHFGIEREALRVNKQGDLATSPHPDVFGSKLTHPFITTDFAESQLELITPTLTSLEDVHHMLTGLFDIVVSEVGDELIWPQSMPAVINEEKIKVSCYSDDDAGQKAANYRDMLLHKYGGSRQLISGIHYNFSFSDEFLKTLYLDSTQSLNFKEFKNDFYLKVVRNYLRYRWLLIYLLGATPMLHQTYDTKCSKKLSEISQGTFTNGAAISYRNSMCGYKNKHQLLPNYESVEGYVESLHSFIASDFITSHKELYSSIRLKAKDPHQLLDSLLEDGIQYLEIRSIDINPFEKGGIALKDMYFIHLFILFLATEEETEYKNWQEEANDNENKVALHGLSEDTLLTRDGVPQSIKQYGADVLGKILKMNKELGLDKFEIIEEKLKMVNKDIQLPSQRLIKMSENTNYIEAHLSLAKTYKEESLANPFGLVGYEDMELSTQILIRESLKQGILVEILDRGENFIAIKKGDKVEYVKQATKTSLDSYSTVLVMENKVVTKEVLNQQNIKVPGGAIYHSIEEARLDASKQIGYPIVVKPKSTNFGLGISIFTEGASEEDFNQAIEIAFNHDSTVLVEEFISGKEYRFLVIDGEVTGILHRVPANVCGDGIHTIKQLVELKNEDPLRGVGYKKPLEKIVVDESAKLFLKAQGFSENTILPLGTIVYLRENSNISTGGDSIDFTDEISIVFKEIAIKASKAVDATICGVDMMIDSLEDNNSDYAIIELNFNPAIHIHCFPYKGKRRNIAYSVLKALKFI